MLVVAAAVGLVLSLAQPGSNDPTAANMTPAAFVTAAAEHTLVQKSVDIVLSGSFHAQGHSLPVKGGGEMDIAARAMDLRMQFELGRHSVTEEVRFIDQDMFLSVSVDGRNLFLDQTGTASWLSMPFGQFIARSQPGNNPLASLGLFEHSGAAVQTLGTKRIDGRECSGFSVTPSEAMMIQARNEAESSLGLTPAQRAQFESEFGLQPPTVEMWIDRQRLVRQMTESMQVSGGAGGSVSGQIVLGFENYGAAVHLTAPPASEVMPYRTFINRAGATLAASTQISGRGVRGLPAARAPQL